MRCARAGQETVPHRYFLSKPQASAVDTYMHRGSRDGQAKYEMYVDIGAYGIPKKVLDKQPFDIVKESVAVEAYVGQARGFQVRTRTPRAHARRCECSARAHPHIFARAPHPRA